MAPGVFRPPAADPSDFTHPRLAGGGGEARSDGERPVAAASPQCDGSWPPDLPTEEERIIG